MALSDAALTVGATAIDAAITHMGLHSAAPGGSGTSNVIGTRVAVNGTPDSDGDIVWTNVAFTGLSAGATVHSVSYWSASSSGTFYGSAVLTGDTTANAAGEYTVTSVTETGTAS
jgi:hypothetical protein